MKSILIADDHVLVRKGLAMLVKDVFFSNCKIDFADNGEEVLSKLKTGTIDMLITDINMPDTNSLEMVSQAIALVPKLRILIVSVNPENVFGPRFLKAGAHGYICKTASDEETTEAIRSVGSGKRYITDELSRHFAEIFLNGSPDNPFDALSRREFEVTTLLLKGYGALEIANTLSINHSTASSYKFRVFEKLGIKNVLELDRLAKQFHIIES